MAKMRFRLSIERDELLKYYQGAARVVLVRGTEGQRIQFPAEHLRPFVGHNGVSGLFEIEFDSRHRFLALQRLSD